MFAELFTKTNHSFLEGASHPEEIILTASKISLYAIGITDRNGVYGIPKAHTKAKDALIPLISGAQVETPYGEVFLLARNRNGYGNLCEILTQIHSDVSKSTKVKLAQWPYLFEKCQDLFFCIPATDVENHPIKEILWQLKGKLYLIVTNHLDGKDRLQKEASIYFSKKYQIQVLASNMPVFHSRQRKPLQDVLTCIKYGCTLNRAGFRLLQNAEAYIKSASQMKALFPDNPDWIENTVYVAEQCQFSLKEIQYSYPCEWLPEEETGSSYLSKIVWQKARQKHNNHIPDHVSLQIQKELDLIIELSYSDYFLTIWEIINFAKSRGILYQGRGSAANSIVCYILEITSIDPVRMELLFERFISRERKEPPDIDLDFEHERREEVIQYIYTRFGMTRAAITCELICFRRKSSIKDVGKALSIPTSIIEKFLILTHRRDLRKFPISELESEFPDYSSVKLRQYYSLASEILSFPRHIGTHVGGFVICKDQLSRNVPIEKGSMKDRFIIQWDKNDLDALGFVRVDILGLGILTCIRKSFEELKSLYKIDLSLNTIPPEDPAIYQAICKADTVGVFQIESRAQMNMLPRLRPENFFDLVVEISLVRPGPIKGQMIQPYLRRRNGKEPVTYAHPALKPILNKTFGIPLFQEQVMKMAMAVAGFTAGEADELRRSIGNSKKDDGHRLTEIGEKFFLGLTKNGLTNHGAEKILDQIAGFAQYGFPESHAASFAILVYGSAFIKVYYPEVFLSALLNSQPMGFYGIHTLIHDAVRHGVEVLPVDLSHSRWDNYCPKKNQVRLGFREIKGLSSIVGNALVKMRNVRPFVSLEDLANRLKKELPPSTLIKRALFLLAGADALKSFSLSRRQAFWEIQALEIKDNTIIQTDEEITTLPQESQWEKIELDYAAQGVCLHEHPVAYFRKALNKKGAIHSAQLKNLLPKFTKNKQRILVCGLVISRQMPPSASGVLFITLEDEYGFINLIVHNEIYQKFKETIITQPFLLCSGYLQHTKDSSLTKMIVEEAYPLIVDVPPSSLAPSHDWG